MADLKISLPVINCLEPKACGACCMEQDSLPISSYLGSFPEDDPDTLPEGLLLGLRAFQKQFEREGWPDGFPCIWLNLDTMQCLNYEHRPSICRDNEDGVIPGNEACLRWREQYGMNHPPDGGNAE